MAYRVSGYAFIHAQRPGTFSELEKEIGDAVLAVAAAQSKLKMLKLQYDKLLLEHAREHLVPVDRRIDGRREEGY